MWTKFCKYQIILFITPRQEYWEWIAILSSRGSSQPRDRTWVSCIAGRFFTLWATKCIYSLFLETTLQSRGDLPISLWFWRGPCCREVLSRNRPCQPYPMVFSPTTSHDILYRQRPSFKRKRVGFIFGAVLGAEKNWPVKTGRKFLNFPLGLSPIDAHCWGSSKQSMGHSVKTSFCKHPMRVFNSNFQTCENYWELYYKGRLWVSPPKIWLGLECGPGLYIFDTPHKRCW